MGKLTAIRNHLYNLFPSAFRRSLEPETRFCLVIIDVMQFLAGKVKDHKKEDKERVIDVEYLKMTLRHNVESYMPQHNREYRATKSVVALLDTPKNVPTNKATTQQKRDTEASIIDETLHNRHDNGQYGIGEILKWPIGGDCIWRSNNARFHLYALITEELLKIVPPQGVTFVIDDGVDINHDLYLQRREQMIQDYGFTERSSYEKECLVANLARHNFTERFVVKENTVERLPQRFIGEADVKIPSFIQPNAETKRYLIVSQDTDLIFVLLLHLKTILPRDADEADPELEIWLDTQMPGDRKDDFSRPYRFINMRALYYEILLLFAIEYPTVRNPIETFVFLSYSLETDYTESFHKCLKVTPRLVWNTFSALHTEQQILREHGYLLFNDHMLDPMTFTSKKKGQTKESEEAKLDRKRSTERTSAYPLEWHGLLNEAVQYVYHQQSDHYQIELDDVKCQSFLYLLCQFRVLDDLASLGYSQFAKKAERTYIPNVDELFIWISTIEAQLESHRTKAKTEEPNNKRKALDLERFSKEKTKKPKLLEPKVKFDLSSRRFEPPKLNLSKLVDDIEEIEIDRREIATKLTVSHKPLTSTTILKNLEALCKKEIPKYYAIPSLQAMLARLFRITWLLNYHQNGSKMPQYVSNFGDTHPKDGSFSSYGWKLEEIPQNETTLSAGYWNNAYYTSLFQATKEPGKIPFRVYKMSETDQVYNRNYAVYDNHFV